MQILPKEQSRWVTSRGHPQEVASGLAWMHSLECPSCWVVYCIFIVAAGWPHSEWLSNHHVSDSSSTYIPTFWLKLRTCLFPAVKESSGVRKCPISYCFKDKTFTLPRPGAIPWRETPSIGRWDQPLSEWTCLWKSSNQCRGGMPV